MKTGQESHHELDAGVAEAHRAGRDRSKFCHQHRVPIDAVPKMYKTFPDKQDHCKKVSRDPWAKEATGKAA
jgi:threonine dehydrogenase-like Zn-dependent dehydrogenase